MFVNARGEAYISIDFLCVFWKMANKVDITNNIFQLFSDIICVKVYVMNHCRRKALLRCSMLQQKLTDDAEFPLMNN